jgi:hypothetical protein
MLDQVQKMLDKNVIVLQIRRDFSRDFGTEKEEFNRVLFGISNSPANFRRLMDSF